MRLIRISAVLFSVALLAACHTVQLGHDFDVGVFAAKVEQGVTTQAQVKGWLGEPTSVGVSLAPDGSKFDEWAYYYGEGEMPELDRAKVKILQVKFDAQGKVRGYNWSASKR